MSDRLYLSCWMRNWTESNMLRHFERLLGLFPFSKLAQRGPEVRVYAIEYAEPAQIEKDFAPGADPRLLVDTAREFMHDDCLCEVDAAWDLWQFDPEWKLAPASVVLSCFGERFENEIGDHLRVDFGVESRFVPDPGIEGSVRMSQSNLKSLVHLVHEVERALPLDRRQLWSESGESPAEMITKALVN
ncbi:MAG TPA: hypothetical protein VMG40_07665 [Bryobacteraceae bacterium]|nr:hypothetical protein [Bryobacteraceae bacterium]